MNIFLKLKNSFYTSQSLYWAKTLDNYVTIPSVHYHKRESGKNNLQTWEFGILIYFPFWCTIFQCAGCPQIISRTYTLWQAVFQCTPVFSQPLLISGLEESDGLILWIPIFLMSLLLPYLFLWSGIKSVVYLRKVILVSDLKEGTNAFLLWSPH